MEIAIIIFLSFVVFNEGRGLVTERNIVLYLIYLLPVILFSYLYQKKQVLIPKRITKFFLIFLILSFFSTIFSGNINQPIKWFLFYCSLFLTFILVYNLKKKFGPAVFLTTVFFGLIFSTYSIFFNYFLPKGWEVLIPSRGFQYIYAIYKTHNPLGSFLVIPITLLLIEATIKKSRFYWVLFFCLFPFFIFSYSRASYVAFTLSMGLFFWTKKESLEKKTKYLFLLLISLSTFIFILVQFNNNYPNFRKLTSKYIKNINLEKKGFLGTRDKYFSVAIKGIKEKPLFGFGPGNIYFATIKNASSSEGTAETADNLFLEVFSEHGIPAGIIFLIIIGLIIKKGYRNPYFYSFLAMLLLFQIDSSQRYYSYYFIFFIIAGLIYEEKENINDKNNLCFIISIILFYFLLRIVLSDVFLQLGKNKIAFYLFPANKTAIRNTKFINLYEKLYSNSPDDLIFMADKHLELEEKDRAIRLYEKAILLDPLNKIEALRKIYKLDKSSFVKMVNFYKKRGLDKRWDIIENLRNICWETDENLCQKTGIDTYNFYEPPANTIEKFDEDKLNKAKYTINKDTLNERFNYPVKKGKEVYRIITLGDSLTYGLYTNTDDNWTELLEGQLNKNFRCPNIKKFEVINLGVHGYDIGHTVERHKARGEKYKADLIIWPIRSFYKINELMKRKIKYFQEHNEKNLTEDEIWEKAKKEIREELGDEAILEKQKKQLDRLFNKTKTKTIFINTGDINEEERKILPPDSKTIEVIIPETEYYPDTGVLNNNGHQLLTDIIYEYFTEGLVINCQK